MDFEPAISQKEVWYAFAYEEDVRRGLQAKVAFEAAKGEKTIAQIASEFSVHPNQIRLWRNHLMEQLPELFSSRRPQQEKVREELEWLKKRSQTLLSR